MVLNVVLPPPRLSEEKREPHASIDSTEAPVVICGGSLAGSAMRSWNAFRRAVR